MEKIKLLGESKLYRCSACGTTFIKKRYKNDGESCPICGGGPFLFGGICYAGIDLSDGKDMTGERNIILRSCKVNGRKGYFHQWEQYSEVLKPSLLYSEDRGGQLSQIFGIVEFEDGTIERCDPSKIIFMNSKKTLEPPKPQLSKF